MELNETNTPEIEPQAAIEGTVNETEVEALEDDEPVNLQANDEPETDETEEEAPEGDEEAESDDGDNSELATVEFDGKTFEVPKELERHFMLDRDYTQKSQQNAEIRKTYEAKLEEANQIATITQEEMNAKAHLLSVEQQLQNYQNVDWNRLEAEDPISAQSNWRQFQQLQQEHGKIGQYLQQKGSERTEKTEQMTATRLQETAKYAQENIKGWTPELDTKITEFASQKFPREQLLQSLTPEIYDMMHLAYLGNLSLQKQQTAKPTPTIKAKPLSKVNAKANPTAIGRVEDIDDMDAYAATRRKQMGF